MMMDEKKIIMNEKTNPNDECIMKMITLHNKTFEVLFLKLKLQQ